MYSTDITLNAASYQTVFSTSSGSLVVPVKPSAVVYSQFDYVQGTPAAKGQQGVPINRVRILNTLINQLVTMKKESSLTQKSEIPEMSDEQKDELIKKYQQEIKNTIMAASEQPAYGLAGLMPEPGAVVSVCA